MTATTDSSSIYASVLAQQEQYAQLQEQLAAERRTVANQLQKVHLSRDSGMSGSGYLDEQSSSSATYRGWNGAGGPTIPEDYENDAVIDPVMVNRKVDTKVDKKVYRSERIQRRVIGDPGYNAEGTFYQQGQDEAPIHESHYTTTRTNNQPADDLLDSTSLGSDPNSNLVSRNTSSNTTTQVTTVTRVYRTYERVPHESLTPRDYDFPEEYVADYDQQNFYAKPSDFAASSSSSPHNRKYGSASKRFDYVNANGTSSSTANGDVFHAAHHDLYANTKSSSSQQRPSNTENGGYSVQQQHRDMDNYSASPTVVDGHRNSTVPDHSLEMARYRDPELSEVIEFLRNPSNVIKANAAGHLAHLAFMNDQVKNLARQLGAIPTLLEMLTSNIPEIQRNACGALRNIAFGRGNDENKRAIRAGGGLGTLVKLLRTSQESDVGEASTALLWILSSCDDLKKTILDEASAVLIKQIILPHSGYKHTVPGHDRRMTAAYNSTIFRNSSGVLRNVSSAGFQARKSLRESEDLVSALLHLLKSAVASNDMDNKSIENVVCVLRNLSFRCQEVEDPDYDKKRPATGKKDKEKAGSVSAPGSLNGTPAKNTPYAHLKSIEQLWHVENVNCYLNVLRSCSNNETLEAAVGIIQNLSACYWQPAVDLRASVRKEKGLPVLVELLTMDDDKVVCSVVRAMRNLAVDTRNRELIGKYSMRELAAKIPNGVDVSDIVASSDQTIAAVLATVNEVVRKHPEFARSFLDVGGVERLVFISQHYSHFSNKVVRFSFLVLQTLYAHHGLHDVFRAAGWKESHFVSKPPNMSTKTLGGTDTLGRTFSSQGPTKFEDKTLPRGAENGLDIPLTALPTKSRKSSHVSKGEPVYAAVNKPKHRPSRDEHDHHHHSNGGEMPSNGVRHSVPVANGEDAAGGDSWV